MPERSTMPRGLATGGRHEVHAFRVLLALFVVALAWLAGAASGVRASAPGVAALMVAAALAVTLGLTRGRLSLGWRVTGLALADLTLVAVASSMTGGMWSPCAVLLALPVLEAGLSESPRAGIVVGSAAGLVVGGFAALQSGAASVGGASPSTAAVLVLLVLEAGVFLLVGVFASRFQQARAARARELEDAQHQLRAAWREADAMLESVSSGLLMVAGDGTVRHINHAATTILGLPEAAAVRGRDYRDVLAGGLSPFAACLTRAFEEGHGGTRQEVDIVCGDAPKPVGFSTSVIAAADARRPGVVAIFQDLTRARQQLEEQRRRETLAVIGEMTAGVTHEIRNTLVPLRGSVEVLRQSVGPDDSNAALMDLIVTECDRLSAFIRDLLSFGRERTIRVAPLEVADVLADFEQEIRRHAACGPHHLLARAPGAGDAWAIGEADALRQILLNLAVNALEAMPEGGTLAFGCTRDDAQVTIWLRDDGPGMDADTLARVFEPFFTTKNAGTGLGLPIAARLCERIGATVSMDSTPGVGTTVSVALPAALETAQERVA